MPDVCKEKSRSIWMGQSESGYMVGNEEKQVMWQGPDLVNQWMSFWG